MTESAPKGYAPHFRKSEFTDPWEPLFSRITPAEISLGVWLRSAHCNSRGLVHGGFISALSDNAMGLTCASALKAEGRDIKGLVTVTLTTDFVGMGRVGDWLATQSEVIKVGGSLGFVQAKILAGEAIVARANATFKILE